MPWRLECRQCKAKAKLNAQDKPLKETCTTPYCGGVMEPVVHRAGAKKTAQWQGAIEKRKERAAMQRTSAQQVGRDRLLQQKRDAAALAELIGEEDEDEEELDDVDDDPLFLPSADFRPGMRLTSTGYAARAGVMASAIKGKPWQRIAASAGRGNQNTVMGAHHKKGGALGATDWVNEQKQNAGTLAWEWCHLIADSLGGPTTADNLVAGGYHANTAMMYIEMACKGRSDLEVQVTAAVSAPDVAELITYEIRNAKSKKLLFVRTIDSRTPGFAQADLDALTRDLAPVRAVRRS